MAMTWGYSHLLFPPLFWSGATKSPQVASLGLPNEFFDMNIIATPKMTTVSKHLENEDGNHHEYLGK